MRNRSAFAIVAAMSAFPMQPLAHEGGAAERLGTVHFKVECNAAAQKEIDLAMAYYHSFAWEHYKAPLERALQADPQCGMAHFVRAMGVLDNPFAWPANLSPRSYADGEAALEAARKTGLKSERERAYVEALSGFYKDYDKLAYPARAKALETGFQQVAARYPDDVEATILYALVLSRNFDPTDKGYTNQKKAAAILEPIFVKMPEHPGVAHYLIHSYDYPPLASQGLDAAKRYSKIAPDAAHALHMPSHIFTRVGHWKDSVESNRASVEAAKRAGPNGIHGYDYMTYAYLQMGQDQKAAEVWGEASKVATYPDNFAVAYGMAAMPARVALERRDWKTASALPMTPAAGAYPWAKHPQAEAVNAYARGIGLANLGDVAGAREQVKRLQALRDTAASMKLGYWADQIDIQAEVVRGLASCAEGSRDECMEILAKAATREDATEKHVVTPGPLIPAREALAFTKLSAGMGNEALADFEKVLVREPNRFHATYGAARAAQLAGDHARAAEYYRAFVAIVADSDTQRAEVALARRYLAAVRTY
jgi:Tfp pilus assembly protein PilF